MDWAVDHSMKGRLEIKARGKSVDTAVTAAPTLVVPMCQIPRSDSPRMGFDVPIPLMTGTVICKGT